MEGWEEGFGGGFSAKAPVDKGDGKKGNGRSARSSTVMNVVGVVMVFSLILTALYFACVHWHVQALFLN